MDSGKCWRRRLRSSIRHALLSSVIAGSCAWAQPTDSGPATLDAFLDGVQSLTADFRQEIWTGDQQQPQTQTGTLALERPNRFRWTYLEPTELTVVADGAEIMIYDVELEQVTVAPFDASVGASPAMLLSGDRNVREGFDVVEAYPAEGLDWVKLTPKTGGGDFSSVLIGFDGTTPRRLELVDGLNHVTRIVLDNVAVNRELGDDVFELTVPPGVNVIGDEG
jgi:outer membrane lipoprotein carrier protein